MEYAGSFPGAACCHLIELAILQSGSPPARQTKPGRWNPKVFEDEDENDRSGARRVFRHTDLWLIQAKARLSDAF